MQARHTEVIEMARGGRLKELRDMCHDNLLSAVDKYGSNALHWACGSGHVEVARFFIDEVGFDPNGRQLCQHARTPLHFASRNGHLEVCRSLVEEWGAEADALAEAGVTPFQLAAWQLRESVLRYLAEKCDVNRPNVFECVASHWVALAPKTHSFQEESLLLRVARYVREVCGEDVWMARNAQGHRPLHKAAFSGHKVLCEWLCAEFGCVDDVADDHGNFAADLAVEGGHDRLAAWLRATAAPADDLKVLGLEGGESFQEIRAAYHRAALASHPDAARNAHARAESFDRVRTAYARLTGGSDESASHNPLRDADRFRAILMSSSIGESFAGQAPGDFETRLAVILLEQPNGLSLSQLKKRYHRTWHVDIPSPRDLGCRNLAHMLRTKAHRVATVVETPESTDLKVFSILDKAEATTLLIETDMGQHGSDQSCSF